MNQKRLPPERANNVMNYYCKNHQGQISPIQKFEIGYQLILIYFFSYKIKNQTHADNYFYYSFKMFLHFLFLPIKRENFPNNDFKSFFFTKPASNKPQISNPKNGTNPAIFNQKESTLHKSEIDND